MYLGMGWKAFTDRRLKTRSSRRSSVGNQWRKSPKPFVYEEHTSSERQHKVKRNTWFLSPRRHGCIYNIFTKWSCICQRFNYPGKETHNFINYNICWKWGDSKCMLAGVGEKFLGLPFVEWKHSSSVLHLLSWRSKPREVFYVMLCYEGVCKDVRAGKRYW